MNKKILFVIFITTILVPSSLFSLTDQEIEKIKKTTWCVKISVNVKDVYPQALQYAVFETDPAEIFEKHIMHVYKPGGKKPAKERFMKNINMSVDWNMIFKKITADNLALLPLKTGGKNPFSVRSNSDPKDGKVWIVTKTALKKNHSPICWCIPVRVEKGKESSITIEKKNMFELEKRYDAILKKIPRE